MTEGPLRVLVVDDEPLACDVLVRLIGDHPQLELEAALTSSTQALAVLESAPIDLAFLDVEMPGIDGFELLQAATAIEGVATTFVFVTAYNRYAVRAFETQAVDYLVKPATPERFAQTVERVLASRRRLGADEVRQLLADALVKTPSRLLVRRGKRIVPVAVESIDWVEASGDYVRLHCGAEQHLIERTLREMETLLAPRGFRRIHRGVLVNEARIAGYSPLGSGRYRLELHDGTELVASRTYASSLLADSL